MKKTIAAILLLLFIIPYQTSADEPTDEENRIDAINLALHSMVKVNMNLVDHGSAFFIDRDTVLTNFHVAVYIGSPTVMQVTKYDGTSCTGKVGFRDEDNDLALIDLTDCVGEPLKFAKGSKVGQDAYTLGSPKTLHNIATYGIVSGKTDKYGFPAVYTNAQADSGSSGGAIINSDGELIAVTKARVSDAPYITVGIDVSAVKKFLTRSGVEWLN